MRDDAEEQHRTKQAGKGRDRANHVIRANAQPRGYRTPDGSRYLPHQGPAECARRVRQAATGVKS